MGQASRSWSKETEEGTKVSIEFSRSDVNEMIRDLNFEEKYHAVADDQGKNTENEAIGLNNKVDIPSKTFVSVHGVLGTEL